MRRKLRGNEQTATAAEDYRIAVCTLLASGRGDLDEFAANIEAVARHETLIADNMSAGKFFVFAALFALCCQRRDFVISQHVEGD